MVFFLLILPKIALLRLLISGYLSGNLFISSTQPFAFRVWGNRVVVIVQRKQQRIICEE